MRLSCLQIVLIVLDILPAAQSNEVLKFGNTVGDYIRFKPNMQPFSEAFSICSWIRKARPGSISYWFSYATRSIANEIYMTDDGNENRMFGSYNVNVRAQAGVATGVWYHYCLCWSLSSRTATIHHNGTQTGSFTTPSGRRVTADGYLVLGQEQDSYGGSFDSSQVFGGELHKTNIFSKKLSSSEVSELYSAGRCSDVERKYDDIRQLKWEQILQQPRTGNVRAEMSNCQVELLEEQLADIRKELTDTKTSKDEISDQLNRSEINLNNKSSELEEVRAYLEQTIGQLTEKETKLYQTETRLDQTETRLDQTETRLDQTERKLDQTETKLDQTETKLDQTETKLGQTETRLDQTETKLNQTETRLNQTETRLDQTETRLDQTERKLDQTETKLDQTETKLDQTETKLGQTETRLNQTETRLDQTETRFNQTETHMEKVESNLAVTVSQLNQTEKNLEKTRTHLNATLGNVEELEEELKEIKKSISGNDCFKLPNASRWDVLYTSFFFGNVVTEEMLQILDESWQKLGRFLYKDLSGLS